MKLLIEFTDATQSLMRSIVRFNETLKKETTDQKLINNLSPSEFFSGLYKFLHQIETAFDQKDSILIGDLLEYEVLPFYGEWSELIPEFRKMLVNLAN